ncbi:Mycbpap [Symbiodinium microadriaticum]|nr:Mycbpap [Symbiodinium microadriaticum]
MEGPSRPSGAPEMTSRPQPRRRVVIKRKVSSSTYERHKAKMENLGLDPSDPLPPQSEQFVDLAEEELDAPDPELSPANSSPKMMPAGRGLRMSTSSPGGPTVLPPKVKERKTVSLKTRTLEEQIVAKRYDRALERFAQQQEEWEKFRHHASRKTGRDKEELVVTRAEEYRERLEVMELLDRATPEEIKSGGFNWYHSLRGEGTRFIQVGNMFSGLYLPMKLHKENFVHEIIRKPLLVDLTTARHTAEASGKKKPRSWRDDEYLLARIRKYGAKMKEMAPGQLEYDEIMEPEVKALRPVEAEMQEGFAEEDLMAALLEEGAADNTMPLEQEPLASAAFVAPIEGPNAEVTPARLHFQAEAKTTCTRTIRLRNTGSAAIQFEWVQNAPQQGFQESLLPQDPSQHFTCHQTSGRVLPGEDVQTMFSFTSPAPGTFQSSWHLQTYPQLFEPIAELAMNGSATISDVHWERRQALQAHMVKEQTISLASELAEDIVASAVTDGWKLLPPPLPDLSQPSVQERLFEEVNGADGLFWSHNAWTIFSELREKVERASPSDIPADRGPVEVSFEPPPGARGHRPVPKVEAPAPEALTPVERLEVPSLRRMQAQLDGLPNPEPDEYGQVPRTAKTELQFELDRAARWARCRPLERSPLWWLAYETILEIASVLPGKWAATRQRNGLEPLPFLTPPDDDAAPDEVEEYNQKLEDRKAKLAPEEKEAEVREIFCRGFMKNKFGPACSRFEVIAKEATVTARISQAGGLTLADRLRPYLGQAAAEAPEGDELEEGEEAQVETQDFGDGLLVTMAAIVTELSDFVETMQLPIRASAAEEEAARAELEELGKPAVDEDGKETIPAPLLIVLGGGSSTENQEEVLLKKLELLIGLSRFAEHEKGGVHVYIGGALASYVLSGVLGMSMGASSVDDGAIKASLKEALLEVMRLGVSISLPLDLVCEEVAHEAKDGEEPGEPQDAGTGHTASLAAAWRQVASTPLFLGYSDCRECYISVDTQHGTLHLQKCEPGQPPHGEGVEDLPEEDTADAEAGEVAANASGIPEVWMVRDIGPAAVEQLRMLLRRSRGAIWNGALGCHEDARWQKGTQELINLIEGRLTGAGEAEEEEDEDEEDEEEEEEGDDDGDEDGEAKPRKEPKLPKERPAEFEVAAVLGRDSSRLLSEIAENPALVSFVSNTGEGFLRILRGAPLPVSPQKAQASL